MSGHRIRGTAAQEKENRRTLAYQVVVALLVIGVAWALLSGLHVGVVVH